MHAQPSTTKYCNNPDCEQQNPQPLDQFRPNPGGRDSLQTKCKSCQRAYNRAYMKGFRKRDNPSNPDTSGKRHKSASASASADAGSREACPHKRWYSGDAFILHTVPGFFRTHDPSPPGQEWQVCCDCGFAKRVTFPLDNKTGAAIVPRAADIAAASVLHQRDKKAANPADAGAEGGERP